MRTRVIKTIVGVSFLLSLIFEGATAQVRINEFMAWNTWTKADMVDYDDFSDWIELYNAGSAEADIGGWYLSGSLKNSKKSQIPTGTTIGAGEFLLFWADGNNAKPGTRISSAAGESMMGGSFGSSTTKYYHAGFKLDKDGEQLGLFKSDGTVVDSVTYGKQLMDVSMGRASDGSWAYFDQPTPEAANSTPAKKSATRSGTVSFSPDAGFSSSAQSVTLTASDGSPIYYTTDGSVPSASSTKYSSPISVSASMVIRARTVAADKVAGPVATNTFFKETTRKLMAIEMTTDQKFLDDATIGIFKNYRKYRKVPVVFECFGTDGKPAVRFNGAIEVGSLTNYSCAQKPLQVALSGKYGDEFVTYKFFAKPITKFNRFRLRQGGDAWNTNWISDDLLDPVSANQMAYGYQAYRGVVLFINGKYYGLADLREQFKDEFFKQNYGVDTTGMQEVRRTLVNGASEGWETVHGSKTNWDQMVSTAKSNYETAKSKVDFDHLIDYVIIESFACNVSWGHNEDMWMVPGRKWQWLTTDIDRCWEYSGTYSDVTTDNINVGGSGTSDALIKGNEMFANLMKNTEFKNHFGQRYAAHLNSTLKAERLNRIIDSIVALVMPEMASQASKWGSQRGIKSVTAWQAEVGKVKDFCTERGAYEMKAIAKHLTGGTATLTITATNAACGDIYIEGVRMSEGLSNLTFFKGAPLGIKAVPRKGCTFKGWGGGAAGTGDSTNLTLTGDKTITAAFEGTPNDAIRAEGRRIPGFSVSHKINPFDRSVTATVAFSATGRDHVTVRVFDARGKRLATLLDRPVGPGDHVLTIPSGKYASGVYFYNIHTNAFSKMEMLTVQ